MWYSEKERQRLYKPSDLMAFAKGSHYMTAETAESFTWGLVELDRESGCYRRTCLDSGSETAIINEAKLRDQFKADDRDQPAPWSSGRTPFVPPPASPSKKARR
jgi:hypothetical protein